MFFAVCLILALLCGLVWVGVTLVSFAGVFAKAGRPTWAAFIPFYNVVVVLDVAGKPWWWIFLLLIPGPNFVFAVASMNALAANFGKGSGFAVGLFLPPLICWPLLAFGEADYRPID